MHGSYRVRIASLAGLAVVAFALWFLIKDLSAVDSAYRHAAADASEKYQRDADRYVEERCFSLPGLREPDCVSKAEEAAREGQRKEQDLAAQNVTAWWTKVMGVAALIGMALSAIGVWLVKTTFDETRHANEISAKFQRPIVTAKLVIHDADNDLYAVALEVENVGSSPAIELSTNCEIFSERPSPPPRDCAFGPTRLLKPGDCATMAAFHSTFGNQDGKFVGGVIRYHSILDGRHYTYFCMRIVPVPAHPYIKAPSSRIGLDVRNDDWPRDT